MKRKGRGLKVCGEKFFKTIKSAVTWFLLLCALLIWLFSVMNIFFTLKQMVICTKYYSERKLTLEIAWVRSERRGISSLPSPPSDLGVFIQAK